MINRLVTQQPPNSLSTRSTNETQSKMLLALILISVGTICGLAATDLILPAIPILPTVMAGNAAQAQWVLAAFALGTSAGLLLYGELGARYRIINLLMAALWLFALLSIAATLVNSLLQLSVLRFFQGIVAAAPAVYAPVMIKKLLPAKQAVTMIGRISSIEALAPAIAPIVGVVLLHAFGWRASFYLLAVVSILLAITWVFQPRLRAQFDRLASTEAGYLDLLKHVTFVRHALSHALTAGALLTVVFSAPKIITGSMGGELSDFIVMQIAGITLFIIAANMANVFQRWWGAEYAILFGSALTAIGSIGILLIALYHAQSIPLLWGAFLFVNLGFGIRGPNGFYQALLASGDNDARGSALIVLMIMLVTTAGTIIIAPYIEDGLALLGIVATVFSVSSVILLLMLKHDGLQHNQH